MKSVDTSKEKVKKICEVLRRETIDPARKEGDQIIVRARSEGEKILQDAKQEAARLIEDAKKRIEEERNVFQASMNLACKKILGTLKEEIEKNLFDPQLSTFVGEGTKDPKVVAKLITAMIKGIDKEGVDGDLRAFVSKSVDLEAVHKELAKGIIERLKSKSLEIKEIGGGAQVKIVDQNLTIDMSDDAVKKLLATFVRDDFRSVIFANE